MSRPLVSVVMPVYNGAPYLRSAVESILLQSLQDLELIVVDDGSTDEGISGLSALSDSRLHILRKPHTGVIDTLNLGIAKSTGDYVARMDADDIALPNRLENQAEFFERLQPDLLGGGVEMFSENKPLGAGFQHYGEWLNRLQSHEEIIRHLFIECPIPSPTLFTTRRLLLQTGGYDAGIYPEDYNQILKCFKAGFCLMNTEQKVLRWRDHPARASRCSPHLYSQRFFDLKARYFAETLGRTVRPYVLWGLGRNSKNLFHAFTTIGFPIAGFTAAPGLIREKKLYDLPIRPPEEWKEAFFILATAARGARETAALILETLGLHCIEDFIPFC